MCQNGTIIYAHTQKKQTCLNDFSIQQTCLENDGDPLPQVTHLGCEINEIMLTVFEVKKIICNLKSRKATGPDLIHNKLLVAASDVVSVHQTRFFNRCLIK